MVGLPEEIMYVLDSDQTFAFESEEVKLALAEKILLHIEPLIYLRDECELVGWQVRSRARGGHAIVGTMGAWGPVISRPSAGLRNDPSVEIATVLRRR